MRAEVGGDGGRDKMAAPGGESVEDEEAEPVLGRLEEEARRRQERLRALRQRALQVGGGGAGGRPGSGVRPVEVGLAAACAACVRGGKGSVPGGGGLTLCQGRVRLGIKNGFFS